MMTIKIIVLIILLLISFALAIFSVILLLGPIITGFRKAPYVPSFNYHLKLIKDHLTLRKGAKLLDLGCGDGKALRFFSKEFGLKTTGYDLNPFVILYGKFINRVLGRKGIKFVRSNFNKAHLEDYDYIYMYLFPNQMMAIEDWVFQHITKDVVIISNSFKFVKHTPFEILKNEKGKETIRLYRK